jgi:hypothetical protein
VRACGKDSRQGTFPQRVGGVGRKYGSRAQDLGVLSLLSRESCKAGVGRPERRPSTMSPLPLDDPNDQQAKPHIAVAAGLPLQRSTSEIQRSTSEKQVGSAERARSRRLGPWACKSASCPNAQRRPEPSTRLACHSTSYTDLCAGFNPFWARCLPYMCVHCDGFEVETSIDARTAKAALVMHEVPSRERDRVHFRCQRNDCLLRLSVVLHG